MSKNTLANKYKNEIVELQKKKASLISDIDSAKKLFKETENRKNKIVETIEQLLRDLQNINL